MHSTLTLQDRLLVTGPNGGGVAMLSRASVEVISTQDATGLAIAGESAAWVIQDEAANRLRVFRDGLLGDRRIAEEAMDLHDLLVEDESLWLVATEQNAVLRTDRQGRTLESRSFSPVPDSWHVNSLARHEGRMLASAFGRFETHRGYKGNTVGQGEVFDVDTGDALIGGLSQPHSLLSDGESLWLCSSEAGEVLAYRGGECVRRIQLHGYTRGLALSRDHIYVGISRSRNDAERSAGRRFDTAVVAVLDRSTGDVQGYVPLPWSEIYDIRILASDVLAEDLLLAAFSEYRDQVERDLAARTAQVEVTELVALREAIKEHHAAYIHALSTDIRRMQEITASANERAAVNEAKAEFGRQLDALAAMQERMEAGAGERTELRLEIAAMAERLAASQQESTSLQQELSASQHALAASQQELASSQQEIAESQQALTASQQALASSQRELRGVADERDLLFADLDAKSGALEEARMQLEKNSLELTGLRNQEAHLREIAQRFDQVVHSRTWRWTRPIRLALRLLSGRWSASDSDRMMGLWRKVLVRAPFLSAARRARLLERSLQHAGSTLDALPDQHIATALSLAVPAPGLPDVFVWSVIDWHFRMQRPQHLARAMARKGHRVFYVSVNFVDNDQPGFHLNLLDGDACLYQIHLNLAGEPLIYSDMPDEAQIEALQASLGELLAWTRTQESVSLIQHPYWSVLARSVPNARVVYDCMDHHAGFENNASTVLKAERRLVETSELVIVTSAWLQAEIGDSARRVEVIRNAGEFEFFRHAPAEVFRDEHGRSVIGYYGAIAAWFDVSLVRSVAEANPEALIVLVGHDSIGVTAMLADLPNIRMVGEVPYAQLPYWLHGFDLCLLPFKVLPLTLATNPVKVYEYLAAGKPVVAIDLPEMAQFDGLVSTATDADAFVAAVKRQLATPHDAAAVRRRQGFASRQTWLHRAQTLDDALQGLDEPLVSVIVLTYNNLAFTQACLSSIEAHSDYRNLEVIVVDNASSDGSVDFLRAWAGEASAAGHRRTLILNDANLGFAAGNNVGLAAAGGEILVMLNNDTYVTPGWVRTLCNHLHRDPSLGLVGPVTNNIGNEARIDIDYADMKQMIQVASNYTRRHPGKAMPLDTVAFFCVALPRAVYEAVGPLDEAFGQGFFEDDDYCRRTHLAGWKIACAEDVFVHHHLSASFDQVKAERRAELFERNKAIYEAKWGAWLPHVYRKTEEGAPGVGEQSKA